MRTPVRKGDELGHLRFAPEGLPEKEIPLVAMEDVARGGFLPRLSTVFRAC